MNKPDPDQFASSSKGQSNFSGGGIAVVGSDFGCGKTVVTAAIAHILARSNAVRALKPILSGSRQKAEAEVSFISAISGSPRGYAFCFSERPARLTRSQWLSAVSAVHSSIDLTIVETFGAVGSPIFVEDSDGAVLVSDTADFVRRLSFPVLLVANHREDAPERLLSAAALAQNRGLDVLGLLTVETQSGEGQVLENRYSRQDVEQVFKTRSQAPYLGCIKYSPSINVQRVNQGNLIKMTESGVDLLALYKCMAEFGIDVAVAK
ncbi:MAG TPA: dethiobiotin synthase [Candidatus Obscuribacter sp.]|nr:dethiobiotin synthase [Candidatus Obscuribacter sp.]